MGDAEEQKKQLIKIAHAMGFIFDYDQWDKRGWMRFQLPDSLDEPDLRWVIYKDMELIKTLSVGSNILFQAGQKQHIINTTTLTSLNEIK